MKKIIGFFIFTILFGFSFAETGINDYSGDISSLKLQIESLNKKNIELENRLHLIDRGISGINDDIEKYIYKNIFNSTIDNALSSQANVLTVFSFVFAIVIAIIGRGIGSYVTKLKNKTEIMKNITEESKVNAETILDKSKKLLIDADKILSEVKEHPQELYDQIQDSETNYIMNRLNEIPLELTHFFPMLTTRKISGEKYFKILVNCINNPLTEKKDKANFISLLLQHYPDLLFIDDDLYSQFLKMTPSWKFGLFPNEINDISVKITNEFIKNTNDNGTKFVSFLKFIIKENRIQNDTYKLIYDNLGNTENKFKLYDLIKDESILKDLRAKYFGKYILEEFENSDSLNDEQKQLVENIKKEQEESTSSRNTETNP